MTLENLIDLLADSYNAVMKIATNPDVEPVVRSFYNGKGEAYLLTLTDLREIAKQSEKAGA